MRIKMNDTKSNIKTRRANLNFKREAILYAYDFAQNEEETDYLANELDRVEKELKALRRKSRKYRGN